LLGASIAFLHRILAVTVIALGVGRHIVLKILKKKRSVCLKVTIAFLHRMFVAMVSVLEAGHLTVLKWLKVTRSVLLGASIAFLHRILAVTVIALGVGRHIVLKILKKKRSVCLKASIVFLHRMFVAMVSVLEAGHLTVLKRLKNLEANYVCSLLTCHTCTAHNFHGNFFITWICKPSCFEAYCRLCICCFTAYIIIYEPIFRRLDMLTHFIL
jgi:hypothetical protein